MSKSVISQDYMGKVLKVRPDSLLFARYAHNLLLSKNLNEAQRIAEEGVLKHPNYACGRFVLALCFIEQRDYLQAITQLTELLKVEPTYPTALAKLAQIMAIEGDRGKSQAVADYLDRVNCESPLLTRLSPRNDENSTIYEIFGAPLNWEEYASENYLKHKGGNQYLPPEEEIEDNIIEENEENIEENIIEEPAEAKQEEQKAAEIKEEVEQKEKTEEILEEQIIPDVEDIIKEQMISQIEEIPEEPIIPDVEDIIKEQMISQIEEITEEQIIPDVEDIIDIIEEPKKQPNFSQFAETQKIPIVPPQSIEDFIAETQQDEAPKPTKDELPSQNIEDFITEIQQQDEPKKSAKELSLEEQIENEVAEAIGKEISDDDGAALLAELEKQENPEISKNIPDENIAADADDALLEALDFDSFESKEPEKAADEKVDNFDQILGVEEAAEIEEIPEISQDSIYKQQDAVTFSDDADDVTDEATIVFSDDIHAKKSKEQPNENKPKKDDSEFFDFKNLVEDSLEGLPLENPLAEKAGNQHTEKPYISDTAKFSVEEIAKSGKNVNKDKEQSLEDIINDTFDNAFELYKREKRSKRKTSTEEESAVEEDFEIKDAPEEETKIIETVEEAEIVEDVEVIEDVEIVEDAETVEENEMLGILDEMETFEDDEMFKTAKDIETVEEAEILEILEEDETVEEAEIVAETVEENEIETAEIIEDAEIVEAEEVETVEEIETIFEETSPQDEEHIEKRKAEILEETAEFSIDILQNTEQKIEEQEEIQEESADFEILENTRQKFNEDEEKAEPISEKEAFENMLETGSELLPDHILTPTFAQIYLEQGQPYLAKQIYERLISQDEENDGYVEKLNEVNKIIEMIKNGEEVVVEPKTFKRKKENTQNNSVKPLKGKRIKKEIREKLQQKKAQKDDEQI